MVFQQTLGGEFVQSGVGLHTGRSVTCRVKPADPNTGFVFVRTDLDGQPAVPATWEWVAESHMAARLCREEVRVSTPEHLLSALYGMGVDNALIVLDSEELPVCDGSAQDWVRSISDVGVVSQDVERCVHVFEETGSFKHGKSVLTWMPSSVAGLTLSVQVDFPHPAIGVEELEIHLGPEDYQHDLAWARTFGFEEELSALRRAGLIQGGSLQNAVVWGETAVLNPEGLRGEREVVRHKALDFVGDLALGGVRFQGRIEVVRPGHGFTHRFLRHILG